MKKICTLINSKRDMIVSIPGKHAFLKQDCNDILLLFISIAPYCSNRMNFYNYVATISSIIPIFIVLSNIFTDILITNFYLFSHNIKNIG